MATPIQSFFIPESIRRMRVADSSASPQLLAALRKLRVEAFGDLSGVYLRHFQRVSKSATALFLEVGDLLRHAREGNFAAPSPAHSRLTVRAGLPSVPASRPQTQQLVQTDPAFTVPEPPPAETMFIPQEAQG